MKKLKLELQDLSVVGFETETVGGVKAASLNSLSSCIPYTGLCTGASACPTITCALC